MLKWQILFIITVLLLFTGLGLWILATVNQFQRLSVGIQTMSDDLKIILGGVVVIGLIVKLIFAALKELFK